VRVPFARNSYKREGVEHLSAQRLVNYFAEASPPDAKAQIPVIGTPGQKTFADIGTGPIRGMHDFAGTLCVVSGADIFTVDSAGTGTNRGTVGGSADVFMADNGTQLVIQAETGATDTYVMTAVFALTAINPNDTDFHGASSVAFTGGYIIATTPSADTFFISALNDATAWDATDIATAESDPDNLVACFVDHGEVWLFGETTTEVWYNSGDSDFPFTRISTAVVQRGCLAKHSIVAEDNTIFWLGDDKIVYKAAGYVPQRISTHAIESAIAGFASPATATAFFHTQEGHKFYVLSFDEATFVYDASTQLWHEREGYDTANNRFLPRWRPAHSLKIYGKTLVGDFASGKINELDINTFTDLGDPIRRIATAPPLHAGTKRVFANRLQIEIESGTGLTSGQGVAPQAMLDWSDDGGHTWSNEHWANMGAKGKYRKRLIWRRMGWFWQRVYRLTISDPVKSAIIAANLND
jgi:hypothetical protein|tara:strand:- start:1013 stop:2416 length:1404 start_codon:yes stop_codon:yes gene_type:complete